MSSVELREILVEIANDMPMDRWKLADMITYSMLDDHHLKLWDEMAPAGKKEYIGLAIKQGLDRAFHREDGHVGLVTNGDPDSTINHLSGAYLSRCGKYVIGNIDGDYYSIARVVKLPIADVTMVKHYDEDGIFMVMVTDLRDREVIL